MATIFCTHCGNQVSDDAYACMKCGCLPLSGKVHCYSCGVAIRQEQVMCIKCGVRLDRIVRERTSRFDDQRTTPTPPTKFCPDRVVSTALAIVVGCLGIHKFYLGYRVEGFIMLSMTTIGTFMSQGFTPLIFMISVSWFEAINMMSRDDESFVVNYVKNRRPWF